MPEAPWYAELREKWRPQKVRLLLIGESAPDVGENPGRRRFFYSDELNRHDLLFRATVEAVFGTTELDSRTDTKSSWLQGLRARGIFLIDLVPHPANKLTRSQRVQEHRRWSDDCIARAGQLQPDGILVCHSGSYKALREPLVAAGLPLLHDRPISFPMGRYRRPFVEGLRAVAPSMLGN